METTIMGCIGTMGVILIGVYKDTKIKWREHGNWAHKGVKQNFEHPKPKLETQNPKP